MVGIALLTLVPGEVGGSETYARALTQALAEHGTLEYVAYAPPVAPDAADGLPTVVVGEYRRARSIPERVAAMSLAAARPWPLRARISAARVLHFPLTIRLPRPRVPNVVTLHDVLHLDHPELFPRAERLLRRVAYDGAARTADRVVVPTEFVRDRAVEVLGIDGDRVVAIHHGIDRARFTPGTAAREPFLLYPARPWPHKNHARLLEAFALLRRRRPELRLVLTGAGHERTPRPAGVDVRGLVSGDALVSLYRRAAAVVFPSLYEGFGAPPLEAMACGCAVAVSDIPPLREVCGDAAEYFDPRSPEAIADACERTLGGGGDRGAARAAEFSWVSSARAHEEVYRSLL